MKTKKFKLRTGNSLQTGINTVILCLLSSIAFTQEITDESKTSSPYFIVYGNDESTDQLPLKRTTASVNVVGVIADVTINQVYKNEGSKALEAVYTFPASTNAAVYAMEMIIGNRKIIARIEEKNKARNEYESAKSEGKRTSLLEQSRPNVFQMNVANIMPGDEITVSLKYTELLVPENGTYQFVYPTVVGPRYSNYLPTDKHINDDFNHTPYQKQGVLPAYDFDIQINLSMGMPIQRVTCSTHKIKVDYPNLGYAKVILDKTETKGGNRDFILEYQLGSMQIESGLMMYEHNDENFFLLMVQPPKQIIKDEIPSREYIFIVDVSGSMSGFPLTVTKTLIRNLVVNLRPDDMFNILLFSGSSGWMSEESVPATLDNVEKAVNFIDNQRGGGGTELLPALRKALSFQRKSESLSRSFVVITDGYVTVEKETIDLIRNSCDKANLFAFGIGSGVNRYLIEGMAHAGMGEPFVATNMKEATDKAEKFRKYINNPVLTQVKKVFTSFNAYDIQPVTVPDLLAERPIIIYGKYKGVPAGNITIKGYTGKKVYKKTFNVSNYKPDSINSAIRYLWARKKIQLLDDYSHLAYSETNKKEITDLGLKYNLMTTYTSFLAIEEDIVNFQEKPVKIKQVLPLPEGVPNSAVGFEMDIDVETVSFSMHRDVVMLSSMQETLKHNLLQYIEEQLPGLLIKCLGTICIAPEEIEVSVNSQGKVIEVVCKGMKINAELNNCIKKTLSTMDFGNLRTGIAFRFKVLF